MKYIIALLLSLLVANAQAAIRHGRGVASTAPFLPAINDLSAANWPKAGMLFYGGIPTTRTQCGSTVSPSGHLTPPTAGDDYTLITAAIAACAANGVVQLSSGKFYLDNTQTVLINKGITVRGAACTVAGGGEPPVAFCGTEFFVYNGMLQTYVASGACGATAPGTSPCPGVSTNATVRIGANPNNNLWWAGCPYGVSATGCGAQLAFSVFQGATTVQLNSVANLAVGMDVRIDEASGATTQTNPANTSGSLAANLFGALDYAAANTSPMIGRIVYCPGCTTVEDGQAYGAVYDRETSEVKKISAISSVCPGALCTITFDSPVTVAFRAGSPHFAQVYWPTNASGTSVPFISGAGLENVTIERSTQDPVVFQYCDGCWLKNVETFLWRGGVVISNSLRIELNTVYFHDGADLENNGIEYPVAIDGATTESMITNSIIRLGGKGMVGRSCGGGNVVSYNYIGETMYQANSGIGNYLLDMGVNGSHYVGCHGILFEGNQGDNGDDDETHGNVTAHTFFRNWFLSQRPPFTDPSLTLSSSVTFGVASGTVNDNSGLGYATGQAYPYPPGPLRAAGAMMWDYEMAYVGNVLGISGVTTAANGYVYQGCFGTAGCPNNKGEIWLLGWTGSECGNGGIYCNDNNLNGVNNPQLLFRSGNYDFFTNSIVDTPAGYSQVFPSSLYTSTTPPEFGTSGINCRYAWPWVTPAAGTKLQTPTGAGCTATSGLPAKARWDANTPFVQP